LISKGKFDEAEHVLLRLRESPDDPDNLAAKEEFYQTKEQIRLEAERLSEYGNVWNAVIKKKSYRKRMAIGFLTQWGAEFGGPLIIVSSTGFCYNDAANIQTEQLCRSSVYQPGREGQYASPPERCLVDYCW
jgi:hypothetical protein